jgi:hypothetical protein
MAAGLGDQVLARLPQDGRRKIRVIDHCSPRTPGDANNVCRIDSTIEPMANSTDSSIT